MPGYQVGFIVTRCFIQTRLQLRDGISVVPLLPTMSRGELHNLKSLLNQANFNFTASHLQNAVEHYKDSGQSVVVLYDNVVQPDAKTAIETTEHDLNSVAGSLAVVSRNPVVAVCGFANNETESAFKILIPYDEKTSHATNVHGVLNAVSAIAERATNDDKYALLLRLYRASLRETDVDNQILFQLILLEEASDNCPGSTFAERLRKYCQDNGLNDDLQYLVKDLELTFPPGKDVIDALVKLRNSCAHNGRIDRSTLTQYNGEWLFSLLDDKPKLVKLIAATVRTLFVSLVGHGRTKMATRIDFKPGESFELKFD